MLTGEEFITECYVATLTQTPIDASMATSPNVMTRIFTIIPQTPECVLIVSQGEGRAAQQQQQGEQHPGVRREEHQEHLEHSSDQISQG